jgi:hypothetical protein
MNQSPAKHAVSEQEAASQFLGVSAATLRAWRSQGRGPRFARLGRRVVYLITDLEAFLAANRVETESR